MAMMRSATSMLRRPQSLSKITSASRGATSLAAGIPSKSIDAPFDGSFNAPGEQAF